MCSSNKNCLLNTASKAERVPAGSVTLPGQRYHVDKQCQIIFGDRSFYCAVCISTILSPRQICTMHVGMLGRYWLQPTPTPTRCVGVGCNCTWSTLNVRELSDRFSNFSWTQLSEFWGHSDELKLHLLRFGDLHSRGFVVDLLQLSRNLVGWWSTTTKPQQSTTRHSYTLDSVPVSQRC